MTLGLNGVPTWWCLWNSFHLVVLVLVPVAGEFLSYLVVVLGLVEPRQQNPPNAATVGPSLLLLPEKSTSLLLLLLLYYQTVEKTSR